MDMKCAMHCPLHSICIDVIAEQYYTDHGECITTTTTLAHLIGFM